MIRVKEEKTGLIGFMDEEKDYWIVDPQFEEVHKWENVYMVKQNDQWGVLDAKTGGWIKEPWAEGYEDEGLDYLTAWVEDD